MQLPTTISPHLPILGNPQFPQGGLHHTYKTWAERGLDSIFKFFQEQQGTMKTFLQLQEEYDIPENQIFFYNQVVSYWKGLRIKSKWCFKKEKRTRGHALDT